MEKPSSMNIALTITATTILAITPILVSYFVGKKCSNALSWTERAHRGRENGEWIIEAMLVQAYQERWGMRPAFLKWYLRIVIVVRTAWLFGASATIASYGIKWLPDWFVWPYWTATAAIIVVNLLRDLIKMKQWQTNQANRYHPIEDLPFH